MFLIGNTDIFNVLSTFFRVFVKFTEYMETGLPHLGLKPMDPLNVPEVNFKFFDATVEFKDVALRGFKDSSVIYSEVNPETRLVVFKIMYICQSMIKFGLRK